MKRMCSSFTLTLTARAGWFHIVAGVKGLLARGTPCDWGFHGRKEVLRLAGSSHNSSFDAALSGPTASVPNGLEPKIDSLEMLVDDIMAQSWVVMALCGPARTYLVDNLPSQRTDSAFSVSKERRHTASHTS